MSDAIANDASQQSHGILFAIDHQIAPSLTPFSPNRLVPYQLLDLKVRRVNSHIELKGDADGLNAIARRTAHDGSSFKQPVPKLHRIDGQLKYDLFFVGEMIINRPLRIAKLSRDPIMLSP